MNAIFKKLNYKGQQIIHILNAPESFSNDMVEMLELTQVKEKLAASDEVEFVLAFATMQKELDKLIPKILASLKPDGLLWMAYPKKSSKKYSCDFNRDTGWEQLGSAGYEPVRMIAIDENWSALRFKKADDIKKWTRSFAISDEGKERIGKRL